MTSEGSEPWRTITEHALSIHPEQINTELDLMRALDDLLRVPGLSVDALAAELGMPVSRLERLRRQHFLPGRKLLDEILRGFNLPEDQRHAWRAAHHRIQRVNVPLASGTAEAEQAARRDLSEAENELAAADELMLPALWKVTHARLDYYHQIATGQARQSFRNAQIAMGVGFVLLLVFAVLALAAQSTTGAIVTGALGATSAAFAAYIGRTFVRSQETAATHLRSYFDQPLEFSRYLAAERLLNGIERLESDQRATITAEVLRGMLPTQSVNSTDKPAGSSESGSS